mmetsp:Transcript_12561/g.19015  ORF Transcript_12561/g.19015 Transcript_12561/m.19015 type:complete len:417 (-) Transcript_12561:129-1379(-)
MFSTPPKQPILPLSDPDKCWSKLKKSQQFLEPPIADSSSPHDGTKSTRIVCISDTHGKHRNIPIPKCDLLIHGGDFTKSGELSIIKDLDSYFKELQEKNVVKEVVCIAGNHDLTFQPEVYQTVWETFHPRNGPFSTEEARQSLQNCIYLEDELYSFHQQAKKDHAKKCEAPGRDEINSNDDNDNDDDTHSHEISIYGSPWSPTFGYNWAFNQDRDVIQQKWELIPKTPKLDILVTHGPPLGRGDLCRTDNRAGCLQLLRTVQDEIKPRVHVFGHIHEDGGCSFDGKTLFVNASSVNLQYRPNQPCIVLDLPHDKTLPAQLVKPQSNLDGEGVIEWLRSTVEYQKLQHSNDSRGTYEDLIPFFEKASPMLTGKDLVKDGVDCLELGCDLQMHREKNWLDLVRKLESVVLQLHFESYS